MLETLEWNREIIISERYFYISFFEKFSGETWKNFRYAFSTPATLELRYNEFNLRYNQRILEVPIFLRQYIFEPRYTE